MSKAAYIMLPALAVAGSAAFLLSQTRKKPGSTPSRGGAKSCKESAYVYFKRTGDVPPDLTAKACCPIWLTTDGVETQLPIQKVYRQDQTTAHMYCVAPTLNRTGLGTHYIVEPDWGGPCCHTAD